MRRVYVIQSMQILVSILMKAYYYLEFKFISIISVVFYLSYDRCIFTIFISKFRKLQRQVDIK